MTPLDGFFLLSHVDETHPSAPEQAEDAEGAEAFGQLWDRLGRRLRLGIREYFDGRAFESITRFVGPGQDLEHTVS